MTSTTTAMPPRKLRVFAFDPLVGNQYRNRGIRELTIALPWELDPTDADKPFFGPVGEYIEVIDYDPASGTFYEPIDLNDTRILLESGLAPAEHDPRFHQQMVYAVAMNTIANFEKALGRVALWSPRYKRDEIGQMQREYVQRLRIYPHALREANAYYSPEKKALLFGYFDAGESSETVPANTTIFTCLSHDIIAHETCHALLDGMHPRFSDASNPDVLALHEAFSDIVAIFQHFSFPEVLRDQIAKTRGDLKQRNLLGQLAQEFGQALGRGGALRDALGGFVDGKWQLKKSDPSALSQVRGPHARGSVLVAAVFQAFLVIYEGRVADLLRIASDGTGILREGELHPDLVNRLASEASKSASHVLQMCIRALDYCPPVSVTLSDYLRAIITADHDLYPEDELNYRRSIVESFKSWGIVPQDMKIITEQTLLWPTIRDAAADHLDTVTSIESNIGRLISNPADMIDEMRSRGDLSDSQGTKLLQDLDRDAESIVEIMNKGMDTLRERGKFTRTPGRFAKENVLSRNLLELGLGADREIEFHARNLYGRLFWGLFTSPNDPADDNGQALAKITGIAQGHIPDVPPTLSWSDITGQPALQVHSVRMASRRGKRNQVEREYVVELIQSRRGYFDVDKQVEMDATPYPVPNDEWCDFKFRCGCTLLIDAKSFEIRRVIRSGVRVTDDRALNEMRCFLLGRTRNPANAFDEPPRPRVKERNAFAILHRDYSEE